MNRRPFLAGAVALCVLGICGRGQADFVDGIVATVDTEVILHSDLMREVGPVLNEIRNAADSDADFERQAEQVVQDALDQAIEYHILYRQALLAGLEIPENDIEDRIRTIRKKYESEQAFREALQDAGETMSEFRERLRKQLIAISMGMRKRREFREEAVVSESEMRQYYTDHKEEFTHPERVRLRRIFLSAGNDEAERAKAKARLESLRGELELGADFAELAKAHSEGPDAASGGLVGWVMHGDLVKPLEDAAFALEDGQVSAVVPTQFGFHLLKAEEHEDAGVMPYEEARVEIEPALREQYAQTRYKKWIDELRKRSRVRVFL